MMKRVMAALIVAVGSLSQAKAEDLGSSFELRIRPWLYGSGAYYRPYYPDTTLEIRNCSSEEVTIWIEKRSGSRRELVPLRQNGQLVCLGPGAGQLLLWRNFNLSSRVVGIIAKTKDGMVVAERELYIHGDYSSHNIFVIPSWRH